MELLWIIFISFFLQLVIPGYTELFYLDPEKPMEIWRLVTSIFLHGSFSHLFYNTLAIFFFYPILERTVGSKEAFKIFLLGGIAGNLVYLLFVWIGITPPFPALGASGAIYAVLGFLSVIYPNMIIYVWWFPMRLRDAALLWLITEFLGSFSVSGIGHAAHLGGLLFGIWHGKEVKKKWFGFFY